MKSVANGGKLAPMIIPGLLSAMNPSIFIDDDGDILINIRVVGYAYYHSEGNQRFPSRWGVLAYLHPETDQRLTTENYLCRLNENLEIVNWAKIEMMQLHIPQWEFVGLEDGRLVQWDGDYYLIGVRRDVDDQGTGRMEYTRLSIDKENWIVREVSRKRIPAPAPDDSYCEKNWYPVIDKPYTFIKWTAPTEVVFNDPKAPVEEETVQIAMRETFTPPKDQRGGSHLIKWGSVYITITHEVDLWKNYLNQKDAIYRHRLCVFDEQYNLIGISNPFSFLDAKVEFCVGIAKRGDNLLVSFSVQDNMAYVLDIPKQVVEDLVLEALND